MTIENQRGLGLKYFVLSPTSSDPMHAEASQYALRAYANVVAKVNTLMARELREWAESAQQDGRPPHEGEYVTPPKPHERGTVADDPRPDPRPGPGPTREVKALGSLSVAGVANAIDDGVERLNSLMAEAVSRGLRVELGTSPPDGGNMGGDARVCPHVNVQVYRRVEP